MNYSLLNLEYWALARLITPSRKLRKNDPAVDRMAASMQKYGFTIPILVSLEGEIIDSDLRLKAARQLGFVGVPVIVCDDWTREQVRGFRRLADRSANWAECLQGVAEELAELQTLPFDLSLTGFDTQEIGELSPAYVDVIVQRWQKLTGRQAVLENDGRSFDEIGRERMEVVGAAA